MPGTEVSFPRQEYDMKLEALIQNMTDQIKEAQLKLGYARETMRPLLSAFFPECDAGDAGDG